jgi:hypothetical protein
MRKVKNSLLWKHLEQKGVLATGDENAIKAAKKEYWKEYDKARKQKNRKEQKREIVLAFPADEINHIRFTAKAKGHTIHDYIRACVKADMSQMTVIPHRSILAEIMQVLNQCNNQLEAIKMKEGKGWLVISRTYDNVEAVLKETETRIVNLLKQPVNLKETITENINRNPNTLDLLKSILKTYDN